ncbi:hypothetical protein GCM10009678_20800 [Actinomadura kijaniata]|uniref:Uncharacterized protein n=1 Tax=Actinomadura namibiensis TaxID=182080 RepID=A0A7W3QJ98_ACTNM|nr:hypothetical protein [Actinomadura namibiensis]MBA8949062.1 hypothetical protein [Actinomadura namibiensis]
MDWNTALKQALARHGTRSDDPPEGDFRQIGTLHVRGGRVTLGTLGEDDHPAFPLPDGPARVFAVYEDGGQDTPCHRIVTAVAVVPEHLAPGEIVAAPASEADAAGPAPGVAVLFTRRPRAEADVVGAMAAALNSTVDRRRDAALAALAAQEGDPVLVLTPYGEANVFLLPTGAANATGVLVGDGAYLIWSGLAPARPPA